MIDESLSGAPGAGTMTAREARQALEDGAVLVDVREPGEWSAGHAADAIHIPLAQLTEHLASSRPTGRSLPCADPDAARRPPPRC